MCDLLSESSVIVRHPHVDVRGAIRPILADKPQLVPLAEKQVGIACRILPEGAQAVLLGRRVFAVGGARQLHTNGEGW